MSLEILHNLQLAFRSNIGILGFLPEYPISTINKIKSTTDHIQATAQANAVVAALQATNTGIL